MQLKEYQTETSKAVRVWLEALAELRAKDVKARAIDPELGIDWPSKAWEKVKGGGYFPRRNGLKQPLPSFCLKIPTGGGKTLLATKTIHLVNTHFRQSNRGLVLWIVPTTQIYSQTLAALKDRDHPYRQTLDVASGARTLVLERTQHFTPSDIDQNLCVLLLMLPAAARQTKETLRMFRDSGGFDSFFPEDNTGHAAVLNEVPNRSRHDYFVRGWQPHRIYADFVFTTARGDEGEPEVDRVFVVETKGQHLAGVKDAKGKLTDTGYKRDVFTLCTNLAKQKKWSDFAPFMKNRQMRFEVVDEDSWKSRLTELLTHAD